MKKTMKKFAAIIAAMMTVSALSSMSAFATEQNFTNEPNSNPEVGLYIEIDAVPHNLSDNVAIDEQNINKWNVTINQSELTWQVVQTTQYSGGTYNITWNAAAGHYEQSTPSGGGVPGATSSTITDEATKVFSIQNKSNFPLNYSVAIIENTDNESISTAQSYEWSDAFSLAYGNTAEDAASSYNSYSDPTSLGYNSTEYVGITLDPQMLAYYYGDVNSTKVANASITLIPGTRYTQANAPGNG